MHALTDTILLSSQVHVLLLNKKIIKEILYAVITSMLTIDNFFEEDHREIMTNCWSVLQTALSNKLDGSLPANPVNNRRKTNAVTLKSTFCLL